MNVPMISLRNAGDGARPGDPVVRLGVASGGRALRERRVETGIEIATAPFPERVSGLDGLRGLAVALVVLFHVYPSLLPGGFLGVDVFFVLSGYLITGLLLKRFTEDGVGAKAALRGFWVGRARRLLPELAVVLLVVCIVAGVAGPEFGAGLRAQVAAALVSGTNWLLIAHGQDYFAAFSAAAGHPPAPALQHLWSLAVEEQFYVVWPLVLWGLLRVGARVGGGGGVGAGVRGVRPARDRYPALSVLLLAAATGSFTLMAVNAGTGSSDYYNILTHCGGLLLGAATALRLPLHRLTALAQKDEMPGPRPTDSGGGAVTGSATGVMARPTSLIVPTGGAAPVGMVGISDATMDVREGTVAAADSAAADACDGEVGSSRAVTGKPLSARKLVLLGRFGLGGLVVLVVLSACLGGDTTAPERGGIAAASLATLPVLLASACPGSDVARMLTWRPAVYLGARSYGVYLWHWPLIVLLGDPGSVDGFRAQLLRGVAELCLPIALAGLSRRYLTVPACTLTRADLATWRDRLLGRAERPWRPRLLALLGTAALLPALLGLGGAARVDPDQSALQAQISAGAAVADASTDAPAPPTAGGLARSQILLPPLAALPPSGPPDGVLGHQVTAVGDSVMLAGAEALAARLPGIVIDAKVSRQISEAPDQLSMLAAEGELRQYVIVALGTNGDFDEPLLDQIKAQIGPDRVLVLVTVHMPRSWQDAVNSKLASYAGTHPGTMLIDWNASVSPYPALLWPDATHPRPVGAQVYADLLAYDLGRAQGKA